MRTTYSDNNQEYSLPATKPNFSRYNLNFNDLAAYFHAPLTVVCKHLGIGGTELKKICRKNGIPRWPHRKLRSIDRTISHLEEKQSVSPNPKNKQLIQSLKESRKQILNCPKKCQATNQVKKNSSLKFMIWEGPTESLECPKTEVTTLVENNIVQSSEAATCSSNPMWTSYSMPTPEQDKKHEETPQNVEKVTSTSINENEINQILIDAWSKNGKPKVLEPNLDVKPTCYGLVSSWMIPYLTHQHASTVM